MIMDFSLKIPRNHELCACNQEDMPGNSEAR